MFLLFASQALAHPFQPSAWSMSTELRAMESDLQVVVALEIPTFTVLRDIAKATNALQGFNRSELEEASDRYTEEVFANLGASIEVDINGETVTPNWVPVDSPVNAMASERFFVYFLETKIPLPKGSEKLTVALRNQAHADEDMYLTAKTLSGSPWSLETSSVRDKLRRGTCPVEGAETKKPAAGSIDRNGQVWLRDDTLRTVRAEWERL